MKIKCAKKNKDYFLVKHGNEEPKIDEWMRKLDGLVKELPDESGDEQIFTD